MVTSEEIIERSFYISLLYETMNKGLTINPDDYLIDKEGKKVPTVETSEQFQRDKEAIGKDFIYVFGIGNNQVRGAKIAPRITVELNAYYPGDIGMNKYDTEPISDGDKDGFQTVEYDFVTKHTSIDIHLVANTQREMRILHDIMYRALPAKGYLKPYYNDFNEWKRGGISNTGNLFIEVGNYYDRPNLDKGLLEKVYTYVCEDGLLLEKVKDDILSPITDISLLIQPEYTHGIEVNLP